MNQSINKPTNAIVISNKEGSIFKSWLKVLSPVHKLNAREIDVAALFIDSYIKNKESIINEDLLNEVTLSKETKRKIRNALNLTHTYFQVIIKELKNKGFITKDNKINISYIPSFSNNTIVLSYIIKNET